MVDGTMMIFFLTLLDFAFIHGTVAADLLYQSTGSCYGVLGPASNFMFSSCPTGEVIAMQSFTVAYKPAAHNCTGENVREQDQFERCCLRIDENDCQHTYNANPTNNVQYIEACNGKSSCKVMATIVLSQGCLEVPDHYPNYMHMNYYCIPETSILSGITGTVTSASLGESVNLQSPNFNNGQKIPFRRTLTCSVHTCDIGSTLAITLWQIVLENKWGQCQQRLIVRQSDGVSIYDWQCQSNTATPSTLQTREQFLTIHLENNMTSDLGSFWLGFAGSTSDSRVTVSCPPLETEPCVGTGLTPIVTTDGQERDTTAHSTNTHMTTTTAVTTSSFSTTAGQSNTTHTTPKSQTSTLIEESQSNSSTSDVVSTPLEASTLETSPSTSTKSTSINISSPMRKTGSKKVAIGAVVGGVAGFGLMVLVVGIVSIRKRINKRKELKNTDFESTVPPNMDSNGEPVENSGATNPYESVSSNSTVYDRVVARVARVARVKLLTLFSHRRTPV